MKQHEKTLLDLLGRALFAASVEFPSDVDYTALYEEACMQTVPILVRQAFTPAELESLPPEVVTKWNRQVLMHTAYNIQLIYEQQSVLQTLREQNIPCAILKGSSVACHYAEPTHRVMGDIDILVSSNRQEEAVRLLQSVGYGNILATEHHCHLTISKENLTVEVHREPNGIHMVSDPIMKSKLHDYFTHALETITYIGDIPTLSVGYQAVVLLLHKLEHFLSDALGLRQLCDWACFVNARLTPAEFEKLRPTLVEFGLMEFAGVITRVCVDYLHLPSAAAEWCLAYDRDLASDVMEAILSSGNFGRKGHEDGQRLFSDYGSSGRISSLCKRLTETCRALWPACRRHPILMPIAPFVVLVKHNRQCKAENRPGFHPIRAFRRAGPRQKLYQSLKPFQGE